MLVHSAAPLSRIECAKERMRMPGTLRFSALVELPNLFPQLLLFEKKVPLIREHQFLGRGAIPGERPFVGVDGFDERSEQPADRTRVQD
jgi:hypothetical protein